jgi:hypothetical protein
MAYIEVLHSFKSLVFVSRVFESIQGGRRSAVALLAMSMCFVTALALFLAALHFSSMGEQQQSFTFFSISMFLFAVPEFCADLYVLWWWRTSSSAEEGSGEVVVHEDGANEWAEDTLLAPGPSSTLNMQRAGINDSDLLTGRIDWASRTNTQGTEGSNDGQGLARKLFSTEEGAGGGDKGQIDGMPKVAKVLSVVVCIVCTLFAAISSGATIGPFVTSCQGPNAEAFAKRQAWMKFTSALHSAKKTKCTDVWPQLCVDSCVWGNSANPPSIGCDNRSRPTSLMMSDPYGISLLQLSGTISSVLSEFDSLEKVDLSHNNLFGSIPPQLSSCLRLTALDLSYNVLQGGIPSSLGSLAALKVLRLNNNAIVGSTIPGGVPSVHFPQSGDCEMGGQCSACSYEACCDDPSATDGTNEANKARDPKCSGHYKSDYGTDKRLDTPMCRACGFYSTGTCLKTNSCSNATHARGRCGADCA